MKPNSKSSPSALSSEEKKKITLQDILALPKPPMAKSFREKLIVAGLLQEYERLYKKGKMEKKAWVEVCVRFYHAMSF